MSEFTGKCNRFYQNLFSLCKKNGLDKEKIQKTADTLSEKIDEQYYLKEYAYKPTGLAISYPLPDNSFSEKLWALACRFNGYLQHLLHTKAQCFAFVPREAYHITIFNKSYYKTDDFDKFSYLSLKEKEYIKEKLVNVKMNFFESIVKELRVHGIYTKIITNGITLTYKRAKAFNKAGLNQIEISFDGLTASSHDFSRGKDAYQKAITSIDNAQKGGIPRIGIVFSLYNKNFHKIDTLPEFMKKSGIKECYISLFKKTGLLGESSPFESISEEKIQAVYAKIELWQKKFPHLIITLLSFCTCGRTSIIIGADGEIRPCSFSYKSYGNVINTTLKHIWNTIGRKLPAAGPFGYCSSLQNDLVVPV
ncbi:MAG: radical SAM protein [Spirochaetales bacterium]|nr:radical SAM protein [Spirochaetales bacterium]